ncbi:Uncharacterized protein C1D4.02c [Erysiphe neolycopersici]|uniref:Uncharacterized protein C1D4.02c n=1 Tax=Erysiphe neolycopersici TaxID=212602 RepID=A0A420HSZ3_9PEZI|nr:Uncharacterized protein C1D4.02c [Erysiphe neolycopersici]
MFNALNRFISRLDADKSTSKTDYGEFGFQVLRNNTPELDIEPWFDFIVGINGRMIDDSDSSLFIQEIRNCAGSIVTLGLWSAKGQRVRTIHIPISTTNPSLGLTLQWTSINVASNIWHILDVPANSPADVAGLLPYSDYIIGTPDGVLRGEIGLGELVESHIGRPLRLYIYNNEFDVTREVTIHPSRDWGGEGALGCVLGFGALHRLPAPLSEPIDEPGQTIFETESSHYPDEKIPYKNEEIQFLRISDTSNLLVPTQISSPQETKTPTKKRDKRHENGLSTAFMDEYFMEGEKKSREIDHAPSSKRNLPPPPPKASEPIQNEPDMNSKE